MAAVAGYFISTGGVSVFSGDSTADNRGGETIETGTGEGKEGSEGDQADSDGSSKRKENENPTPREVEEIENLISTWHQAANTGDFDTMWRLLSERKKSQITRNRYGAPDSSGSRTANYPDGRASWETAQEDFIGDLDATDVEVSVRTPSYPEEDVLTIEVQNMFKGSCPWEGITWVRREGGKWYYEPGYLVSPARADDWRDISDSKEGLGDRCSG